MHSVTVTQAHRAQTVPSLNAPNVERRFVLNAEHGVAGNRSANHVAIIT